MAKKSKKEEPLEESDLAKLMKLSKQMKAENVKAAPKGSSGGSNKWRSANPKFPERTEKPANTVDVGGMQLDPERREEYENWRKDKEAEAAYRREFQTRRAKAAAEELRKAQKAADGPDATRD
jgi:hypothetical protein